MHQFKATTHHTILAAVLFGFLALAMGCRGEEPSGGSEVSGGWGSASGHAAPHRNSEADLPGQRGTSGDDIDEEISGNSGDPADTVFVQTSDGTVRGSHQNEDCPQITDPRIRFVKRDGQQTGYGPANNSVPVYSNRHGQNAQLGHLSLEQGTPVLIQEEKIWGNRQWVSWLDASGEKQAAFVNSRNLVFCPL